MAKEEKPLEYQHRIRDTKGVAQRLDLGYLKRPALLALLRSRLTLALVGASALLSLPLLLGVGGTRRTLSNGPLSRAHSVFEGRCEVCHSQAFRAVPDAACERCHDGAAHPAKAIDTGKANRTPPCVGCHIEHRGKMLLSEVVSGNCTSCHAGLAAHASGVKIKGTEIKAFRQGSHPEFAAALIKDTRPLRLNHNAHMPAQPKTIRGMKLPMKCEDCHVTDHNSPTGALLGVTFDKHCKSCHSRELQFDVFGVLGPDAPPSPHTKDAAAIREIVWKAYDDLRTRDPGVVARPLPNELTGQPSAAVWMERVTKASLDYLFDRKCTYCHQTESYAVVKKVTPILGRFPDAGPWFQRGEFSHRAHRPVACDSCHNQARASTRTEDVLIPSMKTCLPCHGESRANLDRCSECHQYHNRSLEKEHERRPTEQLISRFFPGPRPLTPGPRPLAPDPRPLTPGPRPLTPGPRPLTPGPRPLAPGPRERIIFGMAKRLRNSPLYAPLSR